MLCEIRLLIERAGKGVEARYIGVGIRFGFDGMVAVEEIGDLLIRAGKLAQHIGRLQLTAGEIVSTVGSILYVQSVSTTS